MLCLPPLPVLTGEAVLGALPSSGKGKEGENICMNQWEQDGSHEKILPAWFVLHTLNHSPVTVCPPRGGNASQRTMMGNGMGDGDNSRRSVLTLPRVLLELGLLLGSVSKHFQQEPLGVHTHTALSLPCIHRWRFSAPQSAASGRFRENRASFMTSLS